MQVMLLAVFNFTNHILLLGGYLISIIFFSDGTSWSLNSVSLSEEGGGVRTAISTGRSAEIKQSFSSHDNHLALKNIFTKTKSKATKNGIRRT